MPELVCEIGHRESSTTELIWDGNAEARCQSRKPRVVDPKSRVSTIKLSSPYQNRKQACPAWFAYEARTAHLAPTSREYSHGN